MAILTPIDVHCDFCGYNFATYDWSQRTCSTCIANGTPSQLDKDYDRLLDKWQKKQRRDKWLTTGKKMLKKDGAYLSGKEKRNGLRRRSKRAVNSR